MVKQNTDKQQKEYGQSWEIAAAAGIRCTPVPSS
jgi:hypothetical protein